jgi:hypothetical protein
MNKSVILTIPDELDYEIANENSNIKKLPNIINNLKEQNF